MRSHDHNVFVVRHGADYLSSSYFLAEHVTIMAVYCNICRYGRWTTFGLL